MAEDRGLCVLVSILRTSWSEDGEVVGEGREEEGGNVGGGGV